MSNLPAIVTDVEWKAYGLPKGHELLRLLGVLGKRRARQREAWDARDAAKTELAQVGKRAEAAVRAAVDADEELPDTSALRRAAEEALTVANDTVAGVNASVAGAEAEVVALLRREGSDVREFVDAVLVERREAAAEAIRQALELVAAVTEAAELAAAVDPDRPIPRDDQGRSASPARQGADVRGPLREALDVVERLGAPPARPAALHVAPPVRSA